MIEKIEIVYKGGTLYYNSFYNKKMNTRQIGFLNDRYRLFETKREVGESPTRSRHCKREGRLYKSTVFFNMGRGNQPVIRKSGDLPIMFLSFLEERNV